MRSATRSAAGVLAALVLTLAAACTTAVPGTPTALGGVVNHDNPDEPGGVDPSFVKNTDRGEIDRLAATVITDVEKFWQDTFPTVFDRSWQNLEGGYYSVNTTDPAAPTPPCVDKASDIEGNAFYCPTADVIAWDRSALLPVLRDRFGEASVMLVLAHEMGHAVQRRAGITPAVERAEPEKYPTILMEAMADCYAGSFVRWVVDGKAKHLKVARDALDPALESLVTFRDPIGTEQTDEGAHGDAFDRVSAFQDGYDRGAKPCSEMSVTNRTFTQRGFASEADEASGGNMPFAQLLRELEPDVNGYLTSVFGELGKPWRKPVLNKIEAEPKCSPGEQGPVAFCPSNGAIDVGTKGKLLDLHDSIGDWATGTVIASRYGLATMATLGKPVTGPDAQRGAVCLAGSYTGMLIARRNADYALSPGDLDEAVQVLLRFDFPARDVDGKAITTGFDRVAAFRTGAVGGYKACKLS